MLESSTTTRFGQTSEQPEVERFVAHVARKGFTNGFCHGEPGSMNAVLDADWRHLPRGK